MDHFLLSDTVYSGHGLDVQLGVPVTVEQDGRVGGLEVHTEATSSRAHEKKKSARPRCVKAVDVDLSLGFRLNCRVMFRFRITVDFMVRITVD